MTIQILMSTMNRQSIDELHLFERNIDGNILIINQTDNEDVYVDETHHIKMINMLGVGTSRSRNCAIDNASGDICIIADDDISHVSDYQQIVLSAFETNPSADIITFQIITPNGVPFKSNYMTSERWHNLRTVLKGSSIEIAFRRQSVINAGLRINSEFGLGSRYRIHDDVIFLADALKAGLKVKYIPVPLVVHPAESSGTMYNDLLISSKGAAFSQIYGWFGYFVNLAYAVKKHNVYRDKYSFRELICKITRGSYEYCKTH